MKLAWRTWTMSAQLVCLFTVTAAVLMFSAITFIYWSVAKHSDKDDETSMRDRMIVMRSDLAEEFPNSSFLQKEVDSFHDSVRPPTNFIRVLDAHGAVLAETPGMSGALPPGLFTPSAELPQEQPRAVNYQTPSGGSYFLMAAWMGPANGKGERWLIQLAMDRMDEQAFRSHFRGVLFVVLLCCIGATAVLSRVIVRRGLASLDEVVTTMTRVKASRLHERINVLGWPGELIGLAAAFDEMLSRLEESFSRLSRFSADLAHELRTPLFNMRGETEVALTKSRTPEEYRDVLESNLEEISRISQMIDSLLFLARAENPAARINQRPFDGRLEIETIIEFHDAAAAEANVKVTAHGDAQIVADPILFRRAVSNLLSNALQHTAPGGKITLALRNDPDRVRIQVADTGAGISPEHLPLLFDRFYRVDKSRHSSGAGLGLAIVKSIMQMHGGSVDIVSKFGEGTTVTLSFLLSGHPQGIAD